MLKYNDYDSAIKSLYAAMQAEDDQNDSIADAEEWEAADKATAAKYMPRITALEKTRSAIARSTQPKNDWFCGFCESLQNGQLLSAKQFAVFAKYAKSEQACRYKTPVITFCAIVNGKLYSATNAGKKLTIEELTML